MESDILVVSSGTLFSNPLLIDGQWTCCECAADVGFFVGLRGCCTSFVGHDVDFFVGFFVGQWLCGGGAHWWWFW